MDCYAVLGSTGNCGTALIQILLQRPNVKIHAYCRDKSKLKRLLPGIESNSQVRIFEGSIDNVKLLSSLLRGCRTVFLVVSTNDNVPGCRLSYDTALGVIRALESIRESDTATLPKLVLLSSATIDDHLSRHVPFLLRLLLLRSASHVYEDLRQTEKFLRAQEHWLTTIYVKPGALSVDLQRGHALSFTDENSPLSYLDLSAAMVEAVDDAEGKYDGRTVSVVNTHGRAKFPSGTPLCILTGLLRHFFPWMHPYLPATGPS
ncbi:putative NAD-dependent epimerase/dehydratase [Pleurostoma richardsiae]|uniref:NAD-dependent epimerase/dehydratase n=1 Tax=Pleurostoma richardsiae TaxID=41990 RepID=A0AA38RNH8_9PEZI|nr:putative NAD-dependent epimerase/dehydratase [Pleurostoma richardsiae]